MNLKILKELLAVLSDSLLESAGIDEDGSITVWFTSDSSGSRDYMTVKYNQDKGLVQVYTRYTVPISGLAPLVSKLAQ